MSDILEKKLRSMKKPELMTEIVKLNQPLKGYTRMKKEELVQLMLKHRSRFMYLTTPSQNKKQMLAVKKARIEVKKKNLALTKQNNLEKKQIEEADKKLKAMRDRLIKLKFQNKM